MDEKVYTPEVIPDTPFPAQNGVINTDTTQSSANQIYKSVTIQDQVFPIPHIAQELMSTALNTRTKKILQEFNFTPSGALQIGNYQQGINGDIRISPTGILGRDSLGDTTFALDGETGDAVFKGKIQAGSVITGEIILSQDLIIQNEQGTAILDSSGIISSSNFNSNQASATTSQDTTSTTYVDITTPQLTFTASLTRNLTILVFGSFILQTSGSENASAIICLEDNFSLGATAICTPTAGAANSASVSFMAIVKGLGTGEHTLKFRFKIGGATGHHASISADPSYIGYLVLGT